MSLDRRIFLRRAVLVSAGSLLAGCISAPAPASLSTTNPDGVVVATGLDFAEGPAFDTQGTLWCTEVQGGNIVKVEKGQLKRIPVGGSSGGRGNGLIFDSQNRAIVADSGRNVISRYDPAAERWETLLDAVEGHPLLAPNDLDLDTQGNILFTCPNYSSTDPTGYIVCLSPDGKAVVVGKNYHRPNGLAIVDHGKALIVADTFQKTLYKGAWDAAARTWQEPKAWSQVGGAEGPDGMAYGADGMIYQAIYGDGVIRVVDAAGKVTREIKVPGNNPTNVAIDPTGKLGIVVSEAEKGQLISYPQIQPGIA